MLRLENKVALISGGAKGQGAAEAQLFASEGAHVIFGDILDAEGLKIESKITENGGSAKYLTLDVTSENSWNTAVAECINTFGKIDILVNNAGILIEKNIEDTSEAEWDKVQSVNSKGVFLGTKAVIPYMKENGGGSIVNISSAAGIIGSQFSAYGASKGAVRLFSKSTAVSYAQHNIRCNSVHPGFIDTDMINHKGGIIGDEESTKKTLERSPLKMIATAMDVALGVLYLASDESRYVTGSELVIDGGVTAQ
ncbi:MAG: SDR family NAD(P)-dependent oxidoreductase [Dehalococcoidia bacterium]